MRKTNTIAIVYNNDFYLHRFKGRLLKSLVDRGNRVYAIAPAGDSVKAIESTGAIFINWSLRRKGSGPIGELRSILALRTIYRRIKPDLVQHFTAKPNVYGSIAAQITGVPISIASVNGLGFAFIEDGFKGKLSRFLVSFLYRIAFRISQAVIFQNRDDIELLTDLNLLSQRKAIYIPGGSGVDLEVFDYKAINVDNHIKLRQELGIPRETVVAILVGRMLQHKGITEFVESAQTLSTEKISFLLVGPIDNGNPASIHLNQLTEWMKKGWVQYIGERKDVRELLAMSDIVILPSYREGLPRVLLEAAAMNKPIITTNVAGCKDVVEDGITGFLVPVRDSIQLAQATKTLVDSPKLRIRMGNAAREKAVASFDEIKVVANLVSLYESLLSNDANWNQTTSG